MLILNRKKLAGHDRYLPTEILKNLTFFAVICLEKKIGPYQITMTGLFCEKVNGHKMLIIFKKSSIIDA